MFQTLNFTPREASLYQLSLLTITDIWWWWWEECWGLTDEDHWSQVAAVVKLVWLRNILNWQCLGAVSGLHCSTPARPVTTVLLRREKAAARSLNSLRTRPESLTMRNIRLITTNNFRKHQEVNFSGKFSLIFIWRQDALSLNVIWCLQSSLAGCENCAKLWRIVRDWEHSDSGSVERWHGAELWPGDDSAWPAVISDCKHWISCSRPEYRVHHK